MCKSWSGGQSIYRRSLSCRETKTREIEKEQEGMLFSERPPFLLETSYSSVESQEAAERLDEDGMLIHT
jgi:hypothetical protein